jgi:peptidoglycan-associated lipoprotein
MASNAPAAPLEQRIASEVQDVYYDYDSSELRAMDRETLVRDAAALKVILADFPNVSIVLEGHCDERGSAEYNLGLGDRRSSSARDVLIEAGVPASRLKTISLGKERPQCIEAGEVCWRLNRRVHFLPDR